MATHSPQDTKVLLIDDHQLARSLLRGLLREAEYVQFREAAEGDSGLALARQFEPDLICLDMQMSGKSGLEVLHELKAALPQAVIVMVTADNDRDTVLACMNAGAGGYIIKPFNAIRILKVIDAAMAKARGGGVPAAAPAAQGALT